MCCACTINNYLQFPTTERLFIGIDYRVLIKVNGRLHVRRNNHRTQKEGDTSWHITYKSCFLSFEDTWGKCTSQRYNMNKRKTKHSAPNLQTKLTDKVIDAISSSEIDSQKNSNATHKSSFQTYGFSSLTAAHMHKESAQFSFTKNTESHMKKRKRKKRCNRHKPSA